MKSGHQYCQSVQITCLGVVLGAKKDISISPLRAPVSLTLSSKSFSYRKNRECRLKKEYNTALVKMENAKPGQAVELHGLQGAAHLNGTRGHLVRFLREEQRWVVSCEANLKRAEPKKEYFVHPVTGQIMVHRTTSAPVTDTSIVSELIANLHAAVLGAFHNQRKGGVVVSCGDDYMLAIEFDGPHGNGSVYGEMVFADKCTSAQAVVRKRNCQRAT
eukprot:scaffold7278_cov147-Skeletonema_marinoi.AAC.7